MRPLACAVATSRTWRPVRERLGDDTVDVVRFTKT